MQSPLYRAGVARHGNSPNRRTWHLLVLQAGREVMRCRAQRQAARQREHEEAAQAAEVARQRAAKRAREEEERQKQQAAQLPQVPPELPPMPLGWKPGDPIPGLDKLLQGSVAPLMPGMMRGHSFDHNRQSC